MVFSKINKKPQIRRRIYGRRKGHKLHGAQAGLMDNLLPEIEVKIPETGELDPRNLFPVKLEDFWLEIGFGGGEHLLWQAANNSNIGIIGCEPYINGIAKLLSAINRHDLRNVRIYPDDARNILDVLTNNTIARIFLLFPDPWPKTRHHKRRFVSRENLDRLADIIVAGGQLRIASDIPDYIFWSLSEIRRHGAFEWMAQTPHDWRQRLDDWPETRYERKALTAGRRPVYLNFQRLGG